MKATENLCSKMDPSIVSAVNKFRRHARRASRKLCFFVLFRGIALTISVLLIDAGQLHIGVGRRYCTFVQKSETVSSPWLTRYR